jgi:hypothetical protein
VTIEEPTLNSDSPDRKLERFEDLARKLFRVPKSEVDVERAKAKAATRAKRRPQTP